MKSVKYLDMALSTGDFKNDSALAKQLGWSSGAISLYRQGKRVMDNEACVALALVLGIDPMQIIMAADMDRAERNGQHSLWEVFMQRTSIAVSALFALIAINFLSPQKAEAAPVLGLHEVAQKTLFLM